MTVNLLAVGGPANGEWFAWDPNGHTKELRVAITPPIVWRIKPDPVEPWPDIETATYVVESVTLGKTGTVRHYYRWSQMDKLKSMHWLKDLVFDAFIEQGDD